MESGLCVSLDPLGGNEVNVRAVLRAAVLKWGKPRAAGGEHDGALDSGSDDGGASSDDAPATAAAPRRQVANDYDYDDDFIDDDELVVGDDEDVRDTPDPRTAAPDEEPVLFAADAPLRRDQALPVVHPVDPSFYVNRGEIRSKQRVESAQKKARSRMRSLRGAAQPDSEQTGVPPAKKAAKGVSRLKSATAPKQKEGVKETVKKGAASGSPAAGTGAQKRALKQQALTPQGKLAKAAAGVTGPVTPASAVAANASGAESALKKRKTESGAAEARAVSGKPLSKSVTDEVEALRATCVRLFGEKKPRLGDGDVQMCLHKLFVAAVKTGCARLYSDLVKDNRRVVFSDELWAELSKFLRTTRMYLENLGHALHWGNAEQLAENAVAKADAAVVTAVGGAPDGTDWSSGAFGKDVEDALWAYFRAKSEMQDAKNQLASRPRSIKKSMPLWASALKKGAFAKLDTVSEELVLEVMKRIEDGKMKEAKRKREEEKEARKKRKEEKCGDKKIAEVKKTPDAKKNADGVLHKKMAEALPAALRNLASLKARAGPPNASQPTAAPAQSVAGGSAGAAGTTPKKNAGGGALKNNGDGKADGRTFEVIEID